MLASLQKEDKLLKVALTDKKKRALDSPSRLVETRRIKAIEDFSVMVFNGSRHGTVCIVEGQPGGYVQVDKNGDSVVSIADGAWLGEDAIITDASNFAGVACGYTRITKSDVGKDTIIAGRVIIKNSTIGKNVTIYGTIAIKDSEIADGATIIGSTVIRHSKIGKNATLEAAGVVDHRNIEDGELCISPLERAA